jgi:hypothetical protein
MYGQVKRVVVKGVPAKLEPAWGMVAKEEAAWRRERT